MDTPDTTNWHPLPADLLHQDSTPFITRRQARLRVLVLSARMIPHSTDRFEQGYQLCVPAEHYAEALRQLQLHSTENRGWPPPLPLPSAPAEALLGTLTTLTLVGLFYDLTLQQINFAGHHPVNWNSLGNAHADLIMNGEWWRAVTALTLHADGFHLFGNVMVGGIFIFWLAREFGNGLAWTLCLLVGTTGNLLNAWLQHPAHRSVGASTAVFGVLGIVATYNFLRYRHHLGSRQLLPFAAGCALLAMLGVGEETTDIGAHLFGFGSGLVLGVSVGLWFKKRQRPGRKINTLLAAGCWLTVIGCWALALLR